MINVTLQKKLAASKGTMLLDVDFEIKRGQFVTIYGESGAGKTSILRMIAGLLKADSGNITINSSVWFDSENSINLKPQKRNIGFLFQDYALFPNMTVKENLLFALEKGKSSKIVDELITLIELSDLQNSKSNMLSGGQKQRVALARALVRKPSILMLDEPLSALDYKMRSKLQKYILDVHKKYKLTTIMISHEIGEIMKLSDVVYILDNGLITKKGTPVKLFSPKQEKNKIIISGEIIAVRKKSIAVLIGINYIQLPLDEDKIKTLNVGDSISISSKSFEIS